jgi:MarR family transcriptional regulator, organic hydroperoxide resistance regulator
MAKNVKAAGRLPGGPGSVVRRTSRALRAALARGFARVGVPFSNYNLLRALFENDGLTQAELADRVDLDASAVTATLSKLEQQGLVRRVRQLDDRRKVRVFLTASAEKQRSTFVTVLEELYHAGLNGVSQQEYESCVATLEKIADNVQSFAVTRQYSDERNAIAL